MGYEKELKVLQDKQDVLRHYASGGSRSRFGHKGMVIIVIAVVALAFFSSSRLFAQEKQADLNTAPVDILSQFSQEEKIKAVEKAYDAVYDFTYDQSEKLSRSYPGLLFPLGPHGDYSHFNRVSDESYVGYEYGIDDARRITKESNRVIDTEVLFAERSIVTVANLDGRTNHRLMFPVLKHFPGGTYELEESHQKLIYIEPEFDGLENMEETHLKPFVEALKLESKKNFGIMTSHGIYPKLEEDLKKLYPDIAQFVESSNTPASLSPFIIRGLLKKRYGFKGYIVADWFNMGAIEDYLEILKKEHPELKLYDSYNDYILKFILSVYAGNHVIPLVTKFEQGEWKSLDNLHNLYNTNDEFKQLLDDLVIEKVNILSNWINQETINREEFLSKLSFKDKITILLLRYFVIYPDIYVLSDELLEKYPLVLKRARDFEVYMDVWDKSNAIHTLFRRAVLSVLYDKEEFVTQRFTENHLSNQEYVKLSDEWQKSGAWEKLRPIYDIVIEQKTRE